MNKIIIAIAFLLSLASAAHIAGGWQDQDPTKLSEGARQALQLAVKTVQSALQDNGVVNFNEVSKVQSQVVAGTKYRFQLSFSLVVAEDQLAKRFEVVVWEQPAGYNGPTANYVLLSVTDLDEVDSNRLNLVMTGGWSSVSGNNLDETAKSALSAAIQSVEEQFKSTSPVLQQVESAKTQVVAGINYKFVIAFDIGRFEVVVWKRLDGSLQVTQTTQLSQRRLGVAGGWSQLDANNLDDFAKRAANAAIGTVKQLLQSSNGQYDSIITVQSQVVAGINYKFHMQFVMGDGGRVHYEVVVWRKLDGSYVVTSCLVAN